MKNFKPPRRGAILLAALSASMLAAPHVQAFERVAVGTRHFFQCLGLMLSKPAVHEAVDTPAASRAERLRLGVLKMVCDLVEEGVENLFQGPPALHAVV